METSNNSQQYCWLHDSSSKFLPAAPQSNIDHNFNLNEFHTMYHAVQKTFNVKCCSRAWINIYLYRWKIRLESWLHGFHRKHCLSPPCHWCSWTGDWREQDICCQWGETSQRGMKKVEVSPEICSVKLSRLCVEYSLKQAGRVTRHLHFDTHTDSKWC